MERKPWTTIIATAVITSLIVGGGVWFWQQNLKFNSTILADKAGTLNKNTKVVSKNCTGWCVDGNGDISYISGVDYSERALTKDEERTCSSQGWCDYADYLVTGKVIKINNQEKTVEILVNGTTGVNTVDPMQNSMPGSRNSYAWTLPIPNNLISDGQIKIKVGQTIQVINKYLFKKKLVETEELKLVLNDFQKSEAQIIGEFKNDNFFYNNETYELVVAENTKILNVPQERVSKRISDILQSTKEKDIWFGLLSGLAEVIKNGEKIEITGHIDDIGKRIQVKTIKISRS